MHSSSIKTEKTRITHMVVFTRCTVFTATWDAGTRNARIHPVLESRERA